MDDSNNKQDFQRRFLIAIVLSAAILAGWTYFFPPSKPTPNANTAANTAGNAEQPAQAGANNQAASNQTGPQAPVTAPATSYQLTEIPKDSTDQKVIIVESPYYRVTLDSRGAVPVSWILKKSKTDEGEKDLTSIASTKDNAIPLELISKKGVESLPREVPLRVITGDPAVDVPVNENNYQVNAEAGTIQLNGAETKTLEFTQTDANAGLEIKKVFTFRADGPVSDLQVKITRGGQTVPNTRIVVGPSIADQGVKKHHFYRAESETIAIVNGDNSRHQATGITIPENSNTGRLTVSGLTDWAGVGDAYFAMAVVPQQQASGIEFTTTKYEVEIPPGTKEGQTLFQWALGYNDAKETRHLTSALLPIVADGSTNKVFVGAKDHFAFGGPTGVNAVVNDGLGRTVDLESLINYGWWYSVRTVLRPIAQPILWAISRLNHLTGSYGIAIILFTIVLYSLLFPLKMRSAKAMKNAQKHQPRMKEIQDQMKKLKSDDPKMRELQMEQIRLMKDANFIGGCLPVLLQIPFFIALYTAITISVDFRQAAFLWLPDLSAGDPFHLLEFAMAGSMVLSMMFAPATPAMTPEQQMQQKMMSYMMPVMMLYVLWGAPAGLLLYWFIGNIVTFGQQMIINRMNKSGSPTEEEKNAPTSKKIKPKLSTS